jgi:hypothetical protein
MDDGQREYRMRIVADMTHMRNQKADAVLWVARPFGSARRMRLAAQGSPAGLVPFDTIRPAIRSSPTAFRFDLGNVACLVRQWAESSQGSS